MISQNQILRLIGAEEYKQVVDRILSNGRCRSHVASRVLRQPAAAHAAALGLALQRLSELAYRPSRLVPDLAWKLLRLQRDDGLFADGASDLDDATLAASAAAIRGLMTCLNHAAASDTRHIATVRGAIERGMNALAMAYARSPAPDANAIGWAIVLWQLGDVRQFRQLVPVGALLRMLAETGADVEQELRRYAHAMAA